MRSSRSTSPDKSYLQNSSSPDLIMPDVRDEKIRQLEAKIKVLIERLAAKDDAEISVVNNDVGLVAISGGDSHEGIKEDQLYAKDGASEVSKDNIDELSVDGVNGEIPAGYETIDVGVSSDDNEDSSTPKCVLSSMRAHQVDLISLQEK